FFSAHHLPTEATGKSFSYLSLRVNISVEARRILKAPGMGQKILEECSSSQR
ncbi:hypothetical protein CEXT_334601, partial [Caerostris extrusa]